MRTILIDTYTGFIWGDSADLDGKIFEGSPEEFAAALDASVSSPLEADQKYTLTRILNGRDGYAAYRADINGSETVPIIQDGQNQDEIAMVQDNCEFLGFLIQEQSPKTWS